MAVLPRVRDVACVIPALDAGATLGDVVRALGESLPGARLIAVDDGSRDDTHAVARAHCDDVIRFEHNRGKGAALRAGFAAALDAGASRVLTIDADGQHDARFAPDLLAALDDADVAIGARARNVGMPVRRRITNGLATRAVSHIVRASIADSQSGYRAFRRVVIEAIDAPGERYEFETELLIRAAHAGYRITTVPVPTTYGAPSHFHPLRDTVRVIRTIWRHRAGAR
ncbi:MAG: glycosyltransferase family 2 protein [Solirubrobacteraceae bacterium]